jgi:hypothetical protein
METRKNNNHNNNKSNTIVPPAPLPSSHGPSVSLSNPMLYVPKMMFMTKGKGYIKTILQALNWHCVTQT